MNTPANKISIAIYLFSFFFITASLLAQEHHSTNAHENSKPKITNNAKVISKKQTKANRYLRTKYFDIIYPPQSKKSALLLYAHADRYAEEISALLHTKIKKRIPVYLIANNQLLNAYFSVLPYSHIVLYDTGAFDSQLSNLKDNILMVFYHELTHAISLNIRSPFWQGMSSVFGDALSPNMLWSMPLSFIEGVTVSFESRRDMQGRLNDPLVHHFFSQNKIENKSPSWREAASSKNIFPYARWSYLYGGAFSRYLQETYGMEYYARLWHRGGRLGLFRDFTIRQKFKKIYNITLDSAWLEFINSLPMPQKVTVNLNRIDRVKKREKKLYGTITSCQENFIWQDLEKRAVFMQTSSSLKSEKKRQAKLQKLFDSDKLLHRLSCSQDGKLLLVSTMRSLASYPQNIVRIFDIQKKKFLREVYQLVRDADFVNSKALEKDSPNDNRYIVGVRQESQNIELVLIDRYSSQYNGKLNSKKSYKEKVLFKAGAGESFASLYNPSFVGNGRIAFIAANGMHRKILLMDVFAQQPKTSLAALSLPSEVQAMRYLQSTYTPQGWMLTFSFVSSLDNLGKHLYRLAKYDLENQQLSLQQEDISGGVFSPVIYQNNVYYVGHFAQADALLAFHRNNPTKEVVSVPAPFALPKPSSLGVENWDIQGKRYLSGRWLVDGLFLPFINIPNNIVKYNYFAPAFLYATADPTERFQITILPAIFYVKPFFADISASLSYNIQPHFALTALVQDTIATGFDSKNAYRKSGITIRSRFTTALDVSWRQFGLLVSSGFHRYAAHLHSYKDPYKAPYTDNFVHVHVDSSFAMFQKSHFKRRLFFGEIKRGLLLRLGSHNIVNTQTKQVLPLLQSLLQTMGDFYFPVLPLRVGLSFAWSNNMFLNSQGYFFRGENTVYATSIGKHVPTLLEYQESPYAFRSSQMVFGFDMEFFLLTWNMEKVVPALVLAFHDFLISVGYRSNLISSFKNTTLYLDSIYIRTSINTSLLSGLHGIPLQVAFEYAYPLRQLDGFQSKGNFRVLAKRLF